MAWQKESDWPRERLERTTTELWARVDPRGALRARHNPRTWQLWHVNPCDLLLRSGCFTLGLLRRPTRLFAPADVVLCRFTNGGGERCEAVGWSTKLGRLVVCPYLSYARHSGAPDHAQHTDRATVQLVEQPDELPGEIGRKPWFDPDVRRLAAEWLRAADSGSSLGTATGGAIEP